MKSAITIILTILFAAQPCMAETHILCISSQDATNLSSDGTTPMGGGFKFELGVFSYGFVPTQENSSEWSQNWNPAQRTEYKGDLKRYADQFIATSNAAPFTAGTPAYMWGFKGDPVSGEWILFRASNWVWPTIGNGPPEFKIWDAKDATAVIGNIDSKGSPFLMMAAAVTNLIPPATNYSQWVEEELSGETRTAAHEDADGDGVANIFEFIAGTPPNAISGQVSMPSRLVDVSGSKYLQLTIPRRIDRPANLVVEVSSDMQTWKSGSGHTAEVSSDGTSLIVRDLTPVHAENPKRFIRVKASSN